MRVLRWLVGLLLALVALLGAAVLAARFGDGPTGLLAGGPLVAGELIQGGRAGLELREGRGDDRAPAARAPALAHHLDPRAPLVEPLTTELRRKYGVPVTPALVASGSLWLFALEPRP
jgi:hypothetical protein